MRTKHLEPDREKKWWRRKDALDPLIGVPSVGGAPVALPDDVGGEPEPGVAIQQEDVDTPVGFEQPPEV